jgi:hypothetical protein
MNNMNNKIIQIIVYGLIFVIILINITESILNAKEKRVIKTNRLAASVIGGIAGFISGFHGYYEIFHAKTVFYGLFFEADTGRLLYNVPSSEWTGWVAMTIIPNFLITGIIVIIFSVIFFLWATLFIQRKNAGIVLIIMSLLMVIIGGGFIPPALGIIASIFGMRIKTKKNS